MYEKLGGVEIKNGNRGSIKCSASRNILQNILGVYSVNIAVTVNIGSHKLLIVKISSARSVLQYHLGVNSVGLCVVVDVAELYLGLQCKDVFAEMVGGEYGVAVLAGCFHVGEGAV